MTKAISGDSRPRVIAAVDGGLSRRAAAERFGVSASNAVRWVRKRREGGTASARRQGGDTRPERIEAFRDVLFAAIDNQVDITLVELAELLWAENDAAFAPSTIWRFLDRHSMILKRNGARERAGATRRRRAAMRLV
ncbi:hypothetical protein SPH9361_04641 [Sphingobium sp. CECT 9361]|nr:hypothetical protein SPH9361_04641 [Sphingobium sp. CECT 9361]